MEDNKITFMKKVKYLYCEKLKIKALRNAETEASEEKITHEVEELQVFFW